MVFVLISVTFRGLFYVILFVLYMVLLLSCIFEVFLLKLCIDCNSIVVGFLFLLFFLFFFIFVPLGHICTVFSGVGIVSGTPHPAV